MRSSMLVCLASLTLAACSVEPVPLEGLECPCATGWTCDPGTNTCVQGEVGACGRPGAEPSTTITVSEFRSDWSTLNQVRFTWAADGDDDLFEYEMHIAESDTALANGEVLRTVTATENPELARSFLPFTGSADAVLSTIVRNLDGDTRYAARLVAVDSSGRVSCSESVGFRTNPPLSSPGVPLANESHDGDVLPWCLPLVTDSSRAAGGEAFFEYHAYCDATAGSVCDEPAMTGTSCWENLRISGLDEPVRGMSQGDFLLAFFEVDVAIENSDNGYYADLGLTLESGFYIRGGYTLVADGEYHTYQIPLTDIEGVDSAPTEMTLDSLAGGIRGFRVGTRWAHGATVRIDNAAIRW